MDINNNLIQKRIQIHDGNNPDVYSEIELAFSNDRVHVKLITGAPVSVKTLAIVLLSNRIIRYKVENIRNEPKANSEYAIMKNAGDYSLVEFIHNATYARHQLDEYVTAKVLEKLPHNNDSVGDCIISYLALKIALAIIYQTAPEEFKDVSPSKLFNRKNSAKIFAENNITVKYTESSQNLYQRAKNENATIISGNELNILFRR